MKTAFGAYKVVYRERTEDGWTQYVCRRSGKRGERFLLIALPASGLLRRLIPYAARQRIGDFVEDFAENSAYYMVFRYHPGTLLSDTAPEERVRLLKPLLEALVQKRLPPEYAVGVLSPDRILIDHRKTLHFVYAPPAVTLPVTGEDVLRKTAALMERLWPSPPDEAGTLWLRALAEGGYQNLCEAYCRMPEPSSAAPFLPPSRRKRLERLAERLPPVISAVLALLALLLAARLYFATAAEEPGDIRALGGIVLVENET